MIKLNIKIKINELEELDPLIKHIKDLDLNKISELNPEVCIEFGYEN